MNRRDQRLLSNFIGLPIAEDPRKNRPPKEIKDIIEKAWGDWKIGSISSPEKIISENWSKLVGLKLAAKCAPEKIDTTRGLLIVRTSSGAVKQELSFAKKMILKKITQLGTSLPINDIRLL
ncbi:MAG: hypothetical protein CBC16_03340 [Verrucomicrobia bacterium TMED56]|jgi:hypothetical protein|nr:MAG: hypothetical protein CBC16_03340 [Verrucomicrobia bacterium TMED56]|tara:strand:- start:342 stop:704 length:363 start_codon:yes stop_codon:yes gene_type:complete